MRGLVRHTLTELFDRKLIWAFVAITVISVIIVFYASTIDVNFGGNTQEFGDVAKSMGSIYLNGLSVFLSVILFLIVMGTAGLIPNMFVRGRADFFLSKPIGRTQLLLSKFLAILFVYTLLLIICGGALWVALAISYSGFDPRALYVFLFHVLSLFVWLSVTLFAGIITGSTAMSIMTAFLVWVVSGVMVKLRLLEQVIDSKALKYSIETVYQILPKNGEFEDIGLKLAGHHAVESYAPLLSSLAFALVLIYITTYIFRRKDY